MSRKRDDEQLHELATFLNRLRELAGYEVQADWAREAGYPATNLSPLLNGETSVDGYNLLQLIRAAAQRIDVPPELAAAAAADASALADQLEGVAQVLEQLRRRIDDQETGARDEGAGS